MCAQRVTRHTSIRYSSSCHTRVNMGASIFFTAKWSVPLGQRGHVAMVGRILCTKCTLHSNHRLTRVIFQHTKRLLPRSGHFSLHTLASPSDKSVNYDEKQLTERGGGIICSFYLYGFRKYVSYGFPIINFCNPGVHYETPCILFNKKGKRFGVRILAWLWIVSTNGGDTKKKKEEERVYIYEVRLLLSKNYFSANTPQRKEKGSPSVWSSLAATGVAQPLLGSNVELLPSKLQRYCHILQKVLDVLKYWCCQRGGFSFVGKRPIVFWTKFSEYLGGGGRGGVPVHPCIAFPELFGAGIIFFLILAHPVYKMWIIQEPNKLALWNKLHFKEKKWRV